MKLISQKPKFVQPSVWQTQLTVLFDDWENFSSQPMIPKSKLDQVNFDTGVKIQKITKPPQLAPGLPMIWTSDSKWETFKGLSILGRP